MWMTRAWTRWRHHDNVIVIVMTSSVVWQVEAAERNLEKDPRVLQTVSLTPRALALREKE